jgi:hypothetical protein
VTTPDSHAGSGGEGRTLVSRRGLEIAAALFTLAFGATIVKGAIEYNIGWGDRGPEPGYFPFWIGLVIAAASLVNLARAIFDTTGKGAAPAITTAQLVRIAAFVLPMIAFIVLTMALGIYVAMALYLFGVMFWQGGFRVLPSLAVAILSAFAVYLLFEPVLKVPLLKGPLEAWLGLH